MDGILFLAQKLKLQSIYKQVILVVQAKKDRRSHQIIWTKACVMEKRGT